MNKIPSTNALRAVQTLGYTDYIKDGKIVQGASGSAVMVRSSDDLASIANDYAPGSIAYTAGFKGLWQLSAAREWVDMLDTEDG